MPGHDLPTNERGKFYHIDCGPGDIAPYILTCADPGRAEKIARFFHDGLLLLLRNRIIGLLKVNGEVPER
jgi:uridine phosphorylase